MEELKEESQQLAATQQELLKQIAAVEENMGILRSQAYKSYKDYVFLYNERDLLQNALRNQQHPKISVYTLKNELKRYDQQLYQTKQQLDAEVELVDKLRLNISAVRGECQQYCVALNCQDSAIKVDSQTVYYPSLYGRRARAFEFSVVQRGDFQLYLGLDACVKFIGAFYGLQGKILSQALEAQLCGEPSFVQGFYETDGAYDLFTKTAVYTFPGHAISCSLTEMPVKTVYHAETVLKQVMRQEPCVIVIYGKFRAVLQFGDVYQDLVELLVKPQMARYLMCFLDLYRVSECEKILEAVRGTVRCIEIGAEYGE